MGITLDILINNKPAKKYSEPDTNNTYIEGRKGSEYTLKIKNNSGTKKKLILSVDGLNVLTGDEVWEKGYVVDAWGTVEIPGWRIDASKVSKFEFSSLGGSYADSSKGNIGVIGCIVFDEDVVEYPKVIWDSYDYHWPKRGIYWGASTPRMTFTGNGYGGSGSGAYGSSSGGSGSSFGGFGSGVSVNTLETKTLGLSAQNCSASACVETQDAPDQSIGTGWGAEEKFETRTVYDKFKENPSETVLIYYDSAKGLEKRGIKLSQPVKPQAFPGFNDFGCKPPSKKTTR